MPHAPSNCMPEPAHGTNQEATLACRMVFSMKPRRARGHFLRDIGGLPLSLAQARVPCLAVHTLKYVVGRRYPDLPWPTSPRPSPPSEGEEGGGIVACILEACGLAIAVG